MTVKTKQVAGRRKLHFDSYQEVLDDVHQLAAGQCRHLGNWSLGEICQHLAKTMDMSIDGSDAQFPWLLRKIGPFLMKRFIARPMPAGFTIPKGAQVVPDSDETAAGVAALEKAVVRLHGTEQRKPHPLFGAMTPQQWDQMQMRHCELHLSFVVPE
jgi:hypothetical protein